MVGNLSKIEFQSIRKSFVHFFSPRREALDQYRAQWGKRAEDRYRHFASIRVLFDLTCDPNDRSFVDDQVWGDLDLDHVFAELDTCISPIGKQVLYRTLRSYRADVSTLSANYDVVEVLRDDEELRELVQMEIHPLKHYATGNVTNLLFDDLPEKPKRYQLIYLLALASLASLVAITYSQIFIATSFLLVIANFVISQRLTGALHHYSAGYATLNSLLSAALRIARIRTQSPLLQIHYLRQHAVKIRKLRGDFSLMAIKRQGGAGVIELLFYWLNLICLVDIVIFLLSIDRLKAGHEELVEIFDKVASLDAAISISNYLETLDYYANPSFGQAGEVRLVDVVHPLIENAVPNNLELGNKSALITGSNMAGKTTMIKTVGINFILAQTIWIVLARSATIPQLRVLTSIKREESILAGKSNYFVEIELLLEHLKKIEVNDDYLILLDEIYRGTNTVERISASVAVLRKMANPNLVLVTTHDVELQELLADDYEMYHFRENADTTNLFSYKIRRGPCTTRNAIELLKMIGYPNDVTEEADKLARSYAAHSAGDSSEKS